MSAFLKIDRCQSCRRDLSWEWIPPPTLKGTRLAGTGVWRSTLVDGLCPDCIEADRVRLQNDRRAGALRAQFERIIGGPKPCRQFTFDQYRISPGNRMAVECAEKFDAATQNIYFWGPCGVGKTHLAVALARASFTRGASISMVTPFQLVRRLRMKSPEEEQQVIDAFVRLGVLVVDDLGSGGDTPFARQVLQEILDARDFQERGGLVVTSQYPPEALARRWNDHAIPSRLHGMCRIVQIRGVDGRAA